MKTFRWSHVVWTIALSALVVGAFTTSAQDQTKKRDRREFMRQKLEFTKNVMEGLSTENFPLIEKSAKSLRLLSQAAEWEVPFIPNVDEYLPYSLDFQRIADDLGKRARERNLDGATLAFNRMTINCVDCHKFVRGFSKR